MNCFVLFLGVLSDIQAFFDISDSTAGLLHTGRVTHLLYRLTQHLCLKKIPNPHILTHVRLYFYRLNYAT